MKIGLYVCIDNISGRPVDWFVAENDGVAQRNGTAVFSRVRPREDLRFAHVADVDTDDPRYCNVVKYSLVAEDAYKFPETVAVPVSDYENMQKTIAKFQEKVADVAQHSSPVADEARDMNA